MYVRKHAEIDVAHIARDYGVVAKHANPHRMGELHGP